MQCGFDSCVLVACRPPIMEKKFIWCTSEGSSTLCTLEHLNNYARVSLDELFVADESLDASIVDYYIVFTLRK